MTRLLVSVRDVAEAQIALASGVDLLDLKEPALGALGPVAPEVVPQVVDLVAGRIPVSAALGELVELDRRRLIDMLPPRLSYAKLGLAGCAAQRNWRQEWKLAVAAFPVGVRPVAVVYADWQQAFAPPPQDVLCQALNLSCAALLLDTWDKAGGTLLDRWRWSELVEFAQAVREAGLLLVVGGSLGPATIPSALRLAPDFVAVRGAVCRGSRDGELDGDRIEALKRILKIGKNCLTFH